MEFIDSLDRFHMICPHCGYEHLDGWELFRSSGGGDGSSCVTECDRCEQEFRVQLNIAVSYSTFKVLK